VLIFAGNWMLHTLLDFTRQMFDLIPSLLSGA
jgi:flagellar biosynthesis protein FliQ